MEGPSRRPAEATVGPGQASLPVTVLLAFAVTFILARVIVLLIMTRRMPTLYLHLGGAHIHHLNYGIFLLSGVGALLLFRQPQGRALGFTARIYGVGLALTFDEFGMWIHLGGPYWQRASFDAVVVIAAILGLVIVAPSLKRLTRQHWIVTLLLGVALLGFGILLADSWRFASRKFSPIFQQIEAGGPD